MNGFLMTVMISCLSCLQGLLGSTADAACLGQEPESLGEGEGMAVFDQLMTL